MNKYLVVKGGTERLVDAKGKVTGYPIASILSRHTTYRAAMMASDRFWANGIVTKIIVPSKASYD